MAVPKRQRFVDYLSLHIPQLEVSMDYEMVGGWRAFANVLELAGDDGYLHLEDGMSNLVFQMLQEGKSDAEVCNNLGLEAQELLRLKHITGFSKLLADHEYTAAWETTSQVKVKAAWIKDNPDDPPVC